MSIARFECENTGQNQPKRSEPHKDRAEVLHPFELITHPVVDDLRIRTEGTIERGGLKLPVAVTTLEH